ncbi:hypothetical protein [Mesorhizobium sp. M0684]|uniref:hypothetical protein n=1 Tax=unclassified Mesorhizobium TaxID=325217 RepID=UPI00333BAA8D
MKRNDLWLLVTLALAGLSLPSFGADAPVECRSGGFARAPDKLEAIVFSGVGQAPVCKNEDCCVERKFNEIHVVKPNENRSVWVRAVFFDNLSLGIRGKEIGVALVDANGREYGAGSAQFVLTNGNILTDERGFGYLPVVVTFTDQAPTANVYLMRFSYADRATISYSYGPYFYVTRDSSLSLDELDRFGLHGYTILEPTGQSQ